MWAPAGSIRSSPPMSSHRRGSRWRPPPRQHAHPGPVRRLHPQYPDYAMLPYAEAFGLRSSPCAAPCGIAPAGIAYRATKSPAPGDQRVLCPGAGAVRRHSMQSPAIESPVYVRTTAVRCGYEQNLSHRFGFGIRQRLEPEREALRPPIGRHGNGAGQDSSNCGA